MTFNFELRSSISKAVLMQKLQQNFEAKVVFLGPASVGKTSIVQRATDDEFDEANPSTIGACYASKTVAVGQDSINLQIWDTAGQERFRSFAPMYYRDAAGAVIVYSVDQRDSLGEAMSWLNDLRQQTDPLPFIVLVGNKIDLERVVTTEDADVAAGQCSASHYEVSAKTGHGIEELFFGIAEAGLRRVKVGAEPAAATKKSLVLAQPDDSDRGVEKKCC
jgi:Ras-related protein Rab-5C